MKDQTTSDDLVNHPPHYLQHPSGLQVIEVSEELGFNMGNALKYLARSDHKGSQLEDLNKARWYLRREMARRLDEGRNKNVPATIQDFVTAEQQHPEVMAFIAAAFRDGQKNIKWLFHSIEKLEETIDAVSVTNKTQEMDS